MLGYNVLDFKTFGKRKLKCVFVSICLSYCDGYNMIFTCLFTATKALKVMLLDSL